MIRIFSIAILAFLFSFVYGQDIEVVGHLKVSSMDTVDAGENFILRKEDGTLTEHNFDNAVIRYLASLPNGIAFLLDLGETPLNLYEAGVPAVSLFGLEYAGGIIFYLDTLDIYPFEGLVASELDIDYPDDTSGRPFLRPWTSIPGGILGNYIVDLPPPSGPGAEIGDGLPNTIKIMESYPDWISDPDAAVLCDGLSLNGYDDWYLPSILEIRAMETNLYLNGYDIFYESEYWSSTESDNDWAWMLHIGFQEPQTKLKSQGRAVKAVRQF